MTGLDARARCLRLLLVAGVFASALQPSWADEELDLAGRLWALPHLRSPAERAAEVKRLVALDVPVAHWVEALAKAPPFAPAEPGTRSESVALHVNGKTETTQITVHVPKGYDPGKPAPLLMVFHGTGGNGVSDAGSWIPVAEALGMLIVSPHDARGDRGYTQGPDERAAAWAALRWARLTFNVDENRIHATGVSRGGHLVWDLALREPGRFASIAPMIGGPRLTNNGGQNNMRYLENLVETPIRDLQGALDDRFLVQNLRLAFARLEAFGAADAELIEFPELGHGFELEAVDWIQFFGGVSRDPAHARVIRRSAREGEGRALWVEILETKSPVKEIYPLAVDPRRWGALSEAEKRAHVAALAESRTARLELWRTAPGRFNAKLRHVRRFRLLLTADMIGEKGRVEIHFKGRRKRLRADPDARVFLEAFADRFDRTFLPVAAVTVR